MQSWFTIDEDYHVIVSILETFTAEEVCLGVFIQRWVAAFDLVIAQL